MNPPVSWISAMTKSFISRFVPYPLPPTKFNWDHGLCWYALCRLRCGYYVLALLSHSQFLEFRAHIEPVGGGLHRFVDVKNLSILPDIERPARGIFSFAANDSI